MLDKMPNLGDFMSGICQGCLSIWLQQGPLLVETIIHYTLLL